SSEAQRPTPSAIKYRLGFLGAWTLFLIALGLFALSAVAEVANWRDESRLSRLEKIDRLIAKRYTAQSSRFAARRRKKASTSTSGARTSAKRRSIWIFRRRRRRRSWCPPPKTVSGCGAT